MVVDKKYKSKSEWKILINNISPDDFQDLCYDLLRNNNFINLKPRGKGGDGGRDHEGGFVYNLANEKILQNCWFQCKRYGLRTPLNFREFTTELIKAENQGMNRFIVMSNKDMTSNAKSDIADWNKKHKCQVSDWTGTLFLDLLFELPNICETHFPDEEVPPVVTPKNPQRTVSISHNLGNRFGVEIEIKTKDINLKNPIDVGKAVKDALLSLDLDINMKALLFEKSSMLFFALGQHIEAIAFLNRSLDITPQNTNALLIKGYILEKTDKIDDSNSVYDEIIEMDANNSLALNNKSFNLLRQGQLDESLQLIEKCLKISPNLVMAIKNKVKILKALKRSDKALEFLSDNENAFKKSIELMNEKVSLCIELIDLKQAFELNEKILTMEPKNLAAFNNKGVIYEHNSRYQLPQKYMLLALQCFEKVIEIDENYSLGWANKTVVLMNCSKQFDAEKFIEVAYAKFPNSPDVLDKKGVLLLNKKEPKKALKYFNAALKGFYKGEYLYNRANTQFKLKQYSKVIEDLDILLKYEPKNSLAWELKGASLKKIRKPLWKQAFKNAQKFQKSPKSLLETD